MNTGEIVNVRGTRNEIMDKTKDKEAMDKTVNSKNPAAVPSRRKVRPTQRLYVPPAQRNKNGSTNVKQEDAIESGIRYSSKNSGAAELQRKSEETEVHSSARNDIKVKAERTDAASNGASSHSQMQNGDSANVKRSDVQSIESTKNDDESLVIKLDGLKVNADKVDVDIEEMERAIVNINRKSRPLIKHVNVGKSDVLHIDVVHRDVVSNGKNLVKNVYEQITDWEDLFNEDESACNGQIMEQIVNYIDDKNEELSEDDDDIYVRKKTGTNDLEHVVELYDFPSTFRTQDLIQLYHDVNEESMYIKWCDESHALLVLSTPAQAKKALLIEHDIIKSRSMIQASVTAVQVASRCDLKPAMKRPQTNMQTARRLITSHLGTRSRISQEEQQREREELRKAKELKRALRQSENDAWDGHPRPSTA